MRYNYIKFANQTMGEKARSVLRARGISSALKKNPNPNHKEGCNFALFVNYDIFAAFDIIKASHIPNLGIESYGDEK